MNGSKIVMIY